MKDESSKQNKILSLQALRALAFLGIFTFHASLGELGYWGVSVFFVLSGFVMFYSYKEKNLECNVHSNFKFTSDKLRKLYSMHLLTMIFPIIISLIKLIRNYSISSLINIILKIIANIFLVQSWIPQSDFNFSLNGVSWYLSACTFLYFMFPYLQNKLKRYRSKEDAIHAIIVTYSILFLISIVLNYIFVPPTISDNFSKWVTYICPLYRLGDFFIGCNLGYLFIHSSDVKAKSTIKLKYTLLEILSIISLFAAQIIYHDQIGFIGNESFRYSLLYLPISMLTVYLFALNEGVFTRLSTNKILIFIGNISAQTFLIHQLVIKYFNAVVRRIIGHLPNPWIKLPIVFAITIIVTLIWNKIVLQSSHTKKQTEK